MVCLCYNFTGDEMNLINELELYALKNHIPIMEKGGIDFLCTFIKEHQIKRILEIGTAIGYSAICMAQISSDIKIVTLEKDDTRYEEAKINIAKAKLCDQIKVIHIDALVYQSNESFDMIFIDAAKAQYTKFFERYENNLNKDGYIISDNLGFHGLVVDDSKALTRSKKALVRKIRAYIVYLQERSDYEFELVEVGDGVGVSKKS